MRYLTRGKNGKRKVVLCLNNYHAMKTYWASGGIASHNLNLCTRRRLVVSFTPRPLYSGV